MTYGLIEGDALARTALAREDLTSFPAPYGRYGVAPALALVPVAAPVVSTLTAETLGILATIGLGGAALSMTMPHGTTAMAPFDDIPNWHEGSREWTKEMSSLSRSFRKHGGTIGDECAWILSPKTIMARVAQEAHRLATQSGRAAAESSRSISKILASAEAEWISTMSGTQSWWMKALSAIGVSTGPATSALSGPMRAATGYGLALTMPQATAGNTDYSSYFRDATNNVNRQLAQCVKTQKRSLGSYLGGAFGKAFGGVIHSVNQVMGKMRSGAGSIWSFLGSWGRPILGAMILEGISDYSKDHRMDDSTLGRVWDLLDRVVRDAVGVAQADEGEPVTWRIPVEGP